MSGRTNSLIALAAFGISTAFALDPSKVHFFQGLVLRSFGDSGVNELKKAGLKVQAGSYDSIQVTDSSKNWFQSKLWSNVKVDFDFTVKLELPASASVAATQFLATCHGTVERIPAPAKPAEPIDSFDLRKSIKKMDEIAQGGPRTPPPDPKPQAKFIAACSKLDRTGGSARNVNVDLKDPMLIKLEEVWQEYDEAAGLRSPKDPLPGRIRDNNAPPVQSSGDVGA